MIARPIESRGNPRYKALKALIKPGFDSDLIPVEGVKLIREALKAGMKAECFWSFESLPFDHDGAVYSIPEKMYRAVSPTKSGNAPLGIFPRPALEPVKAECLSSGRYLFLDQVQEPGNAGAIVRAAVAFGLDGVIWRRPCVFPFHHACLRASAGTLFHIPHYLVEEDALDTEGICWIGAMTAGGSALEDFSWPRDLVLVMGNEGHGLSEEMMTRLKKTVRIPIDPKAESLNVAGAAHILIYAMSRN